MPAARPQQAFNQLIQRLPQAHRNLILKRCEPVEMNSDTRLCEHARAYRYVYFPITGFISLWQLQAATRLWESG